MAVIKSAQSGTLTRQAMVLDMSDLGRQAQRMLDSARAQAAQIIKDAQQQAQRLVEGADERGHAEGLARGLAEGREAGRREGYEHAVSQCTQQFEQLIASFTAALHEWEQRREEIMHQAREDVIALAIEVARRVTHRVVQADQSVARDQVAAALKCVSKPTSIEIVIHPNQRALIEKDIPHLIAAIASCQHASVREDATMAPGGCIITTAGGRVDASIETQLQRIAEALVPENPAVIDQPSASPDAPSA